MEFPIHWLIILAVVLLLFGGKKIPEVMRGLGEGIRSFKDGMRGDSNHQNSQANQNTPAAPAPITTTTTEQKK